MICNIEKIEEDEKKVTYQSHKYNFAVEYDRCNPVTKEEAIKSYFKELNSNIFRAKFLTSSNVLLQSDLDAKKANEFLKKMKINPFKLQVMNIIEVPKIFDAIK